MRMLNVVQSPCRWAACALLISVQAGAATLSVPSASYPTIQSAVNAAQPGDTVKVSPNTGGTPYNESVTVATPNVTLQGNCGPVIDGAARTAPGISIQASGVKVTGFTVRNFHTAIGGLLQGIYVGIGSDSAEIRGNALVNNDTGVTVEAFSSVDSNVSHRITQNYVCDNGFFGIDLFNLNGAVLVDRNVVAGNGQAGVSLSFANGVTVAANGIMSNGALQVAGIGPDAAGVVIGLGGDASLGGFPQIKPSKVCFNLLWGNAGAGVSVSGSVAQTLLGNQALSNGIGIHIDSCVNVAASGNSVAGSVGNGISVTDFLFGTATGCTIDHNFVTASGGDGIHLYSTLGGTVGNTVTFNASLGNAGFDGADDSGPTAATVLNTWSHNLLGTSSPPGLP